MAPQPPTGAAAAEVNLPPPARVRYLLAELAACEAAIHAARDEGGGARTSRLRAQALNSSAEVDAVKLGSALSRAQVRHGFLLLSSFYTPAGKGVLYSIPPFPHATTAYLNPFLHTSACTIPDLSRCQACPHHFPTCSPVLAWPFLHTILPPLPVTSSPRRSPSLAHYQYRYLPALLTPGSTPSAATGARPAGGARVHGSG